MNKEKKRKKGKKKKGIVITALAGVITCFAIFVFLVNGSVPFAQACGSFTPIRELVKCVAFSPAISAAVEGEYVQPIELTQEKEGIKATIEYVIADKNRLDVFYKLEYKDAGEMRTELSIKNEKGGSLKGYVLNLPNAVAIHKELRKMQIEFIEEEMPDRMQVEMKVYSREESVYLGKKETLITSFTFPLEWDPSYVAKAQSYTLNHDFEVNGQRLTLTKMEIYPRYTLLYLKENAKNIQWLKGIDFYIENEKGKKEDSFIKSITIEKEDDSTNSYTVRLDTAFPYKSKGLNLYITSFTWLNKEKQKVLIDLKKEEGVGLPEGVEIEQILPSGEDWELAFSAEQEKSGATYQIFDRSYYDEKGEKYTVDYRQVTGSHQSSGGQENSLLEQEKSKRFTESFVLKNYPYEQVYLYPLYSRKEQLKTPIEVLLKE